MFLIDAVRAIETVGGVLLGMSGIAFILLAVFVEIRQKSAAAEVLETSDGLVFHDRKFDRIAKTETRPISRQAPARKAA